MTSSLSQHCGCKVWSEASVTSGMVVSDTRSREGDLLYSARRISSSSSARGGIVRAALCVRLDTEVATTPLCIVAGWDCGSAGGVGVWGTTGGSEWGDGTVASMAVV
jgi:hypothetical protein